jgi:pyruvate,orthophosphate dikinase
VAAEVIAARGQKVRYLVGTMIEVPRGAITAGEIAKTAEFFSFGTNDLTQMVFGLSRDDTGSVLSVYREKDIWPVDPFVSIDRDGVGELMRIAVRGGRATKPELKLGICGEHGGDPSSVEFCHGLGLDYVSCSPYRLPIARLAAAQAALKDAGARPGTKAKAAAKAPRRPASASAARPRRDGKAVKAAAGAVGAALAGRAVVKAGRRVAKAAVKAARRRR